MMPCNTTTLPREGSAACATQRKASQAFKPGSAKIGLQEPLLVCRRTPKNVRKLLGIGRFEFGEESAFVHEGGQSGV